jgi:excisionase family DNA binding protein
MLHEASENEAFTEAAVPLRGRVAKRHLHDTVCAKCFFISACKIFLFPGLSPFEGQNTMNEKSEFLSIEEIASNLRCSKAHVYNAINGKIEGVNKLPAISMGRRKLVRRASFEVWKHMNESGRITSEPESASPAFTN